MLITATYSPDDNKIRLTASRRLDLETYARVKAAGFSWAPKLEQFIASAWTPLREDLALELAGEILDEDSTLMERAEERADRFEGYQERRREDAERARAAVSAIADHIPLGQPILVGHHSERHARRDQKRIESGMRRTVDLWRTSEYWKGRAAAAIQHAKYKERPDVRHRRIRTLEAEQRKWMREREQAVMWLQLWNSLDEHNAIPAAKLDKARFIAARCNLTVVVRDGSQRWSAWDVLRPEGERWNSCPAMTPEQCQDAAREAYPKQMVHCDRWITHLDNRLAYERVMLEAQGGYKEPPKRKSKAELPILNYSGTISYRNAYSEEVITGEAVGLTKGQWADINSDYKTTRISACGTHRVRTTIMAPGRRHQLVAVFLIDSKQHPRPTAARVESKAAEEEAERQRLALERLSRRAALRTAALPQKPDPQGDAFRALAEQADAGVQVVAVPQLFPTPPELAARMVELADIRPEHRVLEPSAGTGNLLRAIGSAPEKVAVEIDPRLVQLLGRSGLAGVRCHQGDFLECNRELGTFDRIVMNPPFGNAADIKHIQHAATMLRPGGVLVGLCANGPRQREALQPLADVWEDLPPGSFTQAGTKVNVALFVIRKE